MRLLAIDPGDVQSAFVVVDVDTCRPVTFGKLDNAQLLTKLHGSTLDVIADYAGIEMVASYGMPVGREVFDTCVWIGRFSEAIRLARRPGVSSEPALVFRRDVKLHLCHSSKAKDTNVRQALVDRFAPGQPNHGKGTKAAPGWFHGFAADVWQAYAVAVYGADLVAGRPS